MRILRITSLEWAIGGFIAVMGALMLVAPHQFNALEFAILQRHLLWWGLVFCVTGAAIVMASVIPLHGLSGLLVHLVTAAVLTVLAAGFITTGFWIWAVNYGVLAAAVLAAGLLEPYSETSRASSNRPALDLFALAMSVDLLLSSLLFVFFPGSLQDERFNLVRGHYSLVAVMLLAGGLAMAAIQINPRRPLFYKPAYLLGAAIFLTYLVIVPAQNGVLTGVIFYGLFSLTMAVSPWLENMLPWLSPALLRTRLGLILAGTMAIPLILTVTMISNQEEDSVTREVLNRQKVEASSLADGISHYITLHREAVTSLSLTPGLANMSAAEARVLLKNYALSFPDAAAFALFNADGTPVARSDDAPALSVRGYPVYEQARSTLKPSLDILVSPVYKHPVFAFGAPLLDGQGRFAGLAVEALDSTNVADYLLGQDSDPSVVAYLVDSKGRAIAHPDPTVTATFADLSPKPAVKAALAGKGSGIWIYGESTNRMLVGYAQVPDLKWGVVLERRAENALASVYTGRNLAFGILLAFLVLTAAIGTLLAGWLASPLNSLQHAAVQLAAGDHLAPLPVSRITEIQSLADVFGEMRGRLAQRTAERERAKEALRQANEALEARVAERTADLERANQELESYARRLVESNTDLEDFAYIASHDLQEPLRKIQAFGERLKTRASGQLDPDSQDYIERMRNSARRMQTMIDDLLAYSRVTTKAQPHAPVNLVEVVEEVISDLELRIEQTGGKVEMEEMPVILADPRQMHQLLQNLIGNGLKFHRAGVPPEVRVYGRVVSEKEAEIVVEDNGIGFDEKYLDRIFQPFQRLHGRSEYEGSGIGLAICRKIVERHNGQITARSIPGQGTKFIVTLPAWQPQGQGEAV